MADSEHTSSALKYYRVRVRDAQGKQAFIRAFTEDEAMQIACDSLQGNRDDVEWTVYYEDESDPLEIDEE